MKTDPQSRRRFLKELAALGGVAAVMGNAREAWAASGAADPLGLPIGTQTYPFRELFGEDGANFMATMKELSDAGFSAIELCSPVSYATTPFGSLSKYTGTQLRGMLADVGLRCTSAHYDLKELREQPDQAIAWARDVGIEQMIFWSLNGGNNPTMDDVKRVADEFNRIGEKVAAGGLRLGTHNEGFESSTVDGQRTYDLLIGLTDPRYANFQFQMSTIRRGFDGAEYMTKYPGRFISLHLQDWDPANERTVAIGQGTIDWTRVFNAAKTGGVKNYFVELNLEMTKASVPYLRGLQV